ncbi:zonadhesin-like [Culicoides brevitarsis]|uniref:zonadhesin-like n=1 Tax=Culicoides brevitarsis TaxID=469753 RepID=UPI00307BB5C8
MNFFIILILSILLEFGFGEKFNCPGHYEVFKLDGSACADRCNKHLVKCPDDRKPGCYCMDGYARDLVTNVCRPYPCEDCGEHASYQVCWSESCDNECRFVLKKDYCKIVHIKCPDGCHCDPGYARALNGTCIPECDCAADWEQNSCKGPNEEYTDCGSSCSEACSNEDTMCPDVCQKGCFCRKGYKRHPLTRECIPEKECPTKPPSCKDPNEEWNENGNPCSEACDRAVKICNSDPIPGCYCKKGYLRDQILGICVLEEQCPLLGDDLICDKSEEYKCGNNCWDICTADGVAIKCSGDCRYGCYCRDGFKRNSAGDCVPQEDCGSCKDPEVFTHCGNRCQEKCSDDDMRVCTLECEVGCFCKEGYYRNYAGICVPKENCTSCKDPNEEYTDCGTGCGEACGHENLWCKERCREGCFCRKGYKRHPITGQCVPEKECPKDSTCCKDPNEEWNENGHRCSESCNRDILDCTNETSPGCYCQKGYLRDPILGICVSQDQCPELGSDLICDETEEYRCGNNCWDYCEDGAIRDCPMDCRYGCYCKKGYKYDPKMKKCVKKEECPPVSQCTGHHEIFKPDGSACADRCNKHLVKCKDDRKPGCYCMDGYARDLVTNVCRPYPCEDCGEHASYQVCWNENCDNKCAFILKKDYCKIVYANVQCPDGCHCDPGYARALNGTCIPECDCEADWEQNSCKGPNEEYRFGSRCQDGCDRDIVRCIDDRAWGCYCMEGFARDKNTNVCVPYPCHPSKG